MNLNLVRRMKINKFLKRKKKLNIDTLWGQRKRERDSVEQSFIKKMHEAREWKCVN